MKACRIKGLRFRPSPLPPPPATEIDNDRRSFSPPSANTLGRYAIPEDFAYSVGIAVDEINRLVSTGKLSYLPLGQDKFKIPVERALRDLERMECGPSAN